MDAFDQKKKREEDNAAAIVEAEKLDAQFRIDLKKVLSDPAGVRIFYHILNFSGVWSPTVKTSSEIYVKAGAASVGFEILENVQEICPDNYLKIMQHKLEAEAKRD